MWSLLTAFTPGIDESAISNDTSAPSKPAPDGKRRAERHWWQGGPRKQNLRGKRDSKRSKAVYFERIWVRIARVRGAKATKNDHVGPPKRNNSGLECVFRVRKRLNSVICGADTVYTGCSVRSGYSGCAMDGSARRCLLAILPSLFLVAGPGCSRKFFRERADADVEGIITQKNRFPAWSVKNWHVYPDPCARFADPFNPDRPPYPPDDYATRVLSPNPQHPHKKAGVGRVDGEGYLHLLEQWDIENRAGEPRRAPPEPYMPLPPDAPATFRKQEPAGTIVPAGGITLPSPAATFSPAVGQWVSAKPRFTPPLIDAAGRSSHHRSPQPGCPRVERNRADGATGTGCPGRGDGSRAGTASVAGVAHRASHRSPSQAIPKNLCPRHCLSIPKSAPRSNRRPLPGHPIRCSARAKPQRISEHSIATSRVIASRSIRLSNWD